MDWTCCRERQAAKDATVATMLLSKVLFGFTLETVPIVTKHRNRFFRSTEGTNIIRCLTNDSVPIDGDDRKYGSASSVFKLSSRTKRQQSHCSLPMSEPTRARHVPERNNAIHRQHACAQLALLMYLPGPHIHNDVSALSRPPRSPATSASGLR